MADAVGGCLCGAVRYVCSGAPAMTGACHCRDCQRASGSAFATLMIFPRDAVRVSGEVATYEHKGDSGGMVHRRFCPKCGVHVVVEYDVTPQFVVVMAGTLDDPSLIRPQWNIYTESKQPWVELSPAMKVFDKGFKRD
jgi:hypothetical protein